MGYYTTFNLKADLVIGNQIALLTDPAPLHTAVAEFAKDRGHVLAEDGSSTESSKWYDYEKDLTAFSKNWPNVLFTLSGEGEQSTDVWKLYVLNGKAQREAATFQIAPVDLKKLTN